ncbi:MAG TPA: hypothetical protein VMM76_02860 [Pirellulaceae bacterium]|nr:hypothetical protein [Pirellulaceae bacterium]
MSCTLTLTMLISLATSASPPPSAAPFVAGYDRFFHEADQQHELAGTLLLGELSCVSCHASEDAKLSPKRGPRLDGVGLRMQREWMQRFIAAPQVAKPGTTMPGMLHLGLPEETDRVLQALVAYLSTQRKPFPDKKVGQSATDIMLDDSGGKFGPFDGQLFVGEFTLSSISRVFLEQVDGEYQGACFPFREGFASAVIRMEQGIDGSVFVGLSNRGWSSLGTAAYGLQRLVWTGETPFEIKEMRARPDGFELVLPSRSTRYQAGPRRRTP